MVLMKNGYVAEEIQKIGRGVFLKQLEWWKKHEVEPKLSEKILGQAKAFKVPEGLEGAFSHWWEAYTQAHQTNAPKTLAWWEMKVLRLRGYYEPFTKNFGYVTEVHVAPDFKKETALVVITSHSGDNSRQEVMGIYEVLGEKALAFSRGSMPIP